MINLVGEAKPMTRAGFEEALSIVGCNEAQLRTIIEVEALSCGFLQSKLLVILYERHIFHRDEAGLGPSRGACRAAGEHEFG